MSMDRHVLTKSNKVIGASIKAASLRDRLAGAATSSLAEAEDDNLLPAVSNDVDRD